MPLYEVSIVPLDSIPQPPYATPSDDPHRLWCTSKAMEALCVKLNGMGLAAAQVGLPWNMFVFRPEDGGGFQCYIDCEYEPSGPLSASVEGCLSLPGEHYKVDRHDSVAVRGKRLVERDGEPAVESFSESHVGIMAALMQHEIDHQMGRDRMIDRIGTRVFLK